MVVMMMMMTMIRAVMPVTATGGIVWPSESGRRQGDEAE